MPIQKIGNKSRRIQLIEFCLDVYYNCFKYVLVVARKVFLNLFGPVSKRFFDHSGAPPALDVSLRIVKHSQI